jgi:hypothetical protein
MKTANKRHKPTAPKPTDYVKISRKIYAGQTVDEIFSRSKARLRGR